MHHMLFVHHCMCNAAYGLVFDPMSSILPTVCDDTQHQMEAGHKSTSISSWSVISSSVGDAIIAVIGACGKPAANFGEWRLIAEQVVDVFCPYTYPYLR